MKLKIWAEKKGISYWTALNWFHAGLIKGAIQLPTGTILVDEKEDNKDLVDERPVKKND